MKNVQNHTKWLPLVKSFMLFKSHFCRSKTNFLNFYLIKQLPDNVLDFILGTNDVILTQLSHKNGAVLL